ncbi:MAG: GNAT family N-acetyltransferase [Symbiobacteriaceae bacterium]|nr:GNAT family N-acetyltransferase [Symbiobacteriaceae bacterium]
MYTFRALSDHELDKWLDFLVQEAFVGSSREFFANQWYHDPEGKIEGILVTVGDNEEILSTQRVFQRSLMLEGCQIPMGGIGSVGTKEAFRGRRLASRLFDIGHDYIIAQGMPVAYLYCAPAMTSFYSRFGYQKLLNISRIANLSRTAGAAAVAVRDAVFPDDVPHLMTMYSYFTSRGNAVVVRSKEYWELWPPAHRRASYKIALNSENNPIAYMAISKEPSHGSIRVYDFGCYPGYDNIFDDFIMSYITPQVPAVQQVVNHPLVPSKLDVAEEKELHCLMFKLLTDFELNGCMIRDTCQLLHVLHGGGRQSKLLNWEIDTL